MSQPWQHRSETLILFLTGKQGAHWNFLFFYFFLLLLPRGNSIPEAPILVLSLEILINTVAWFLFTCFALQTGGHNCPLHSNRAGKGATLWDQWALQS